MNNLAKMTRLPMSQSLRRAAPDIALGCLLLLMPLLLFHQQTLGDRTLLPTENLFQYPPYAAYREVAKAPAPHNHLLSDMALQNLPWKSFIRAQVAQGEIPLWNPHLFSGIPFFAAGQHSALYPLSIVYYLLPLSAAYGWFIVLNLWLAGAFMAGYLRALGSKRAGAALAGISWQLCGFLIANAVFPMIVAAAVWLPLILWMIENILRGRNLWIFRGTALLWVAIGAVAVGCNILAGHVEMSIYTLLVAGYYAAFRLLWTGAQAWRRTGTLPLRWLASKSLWLLLLIALGVGLAALQLIPLYEFVQSNWRAERSSLVTVLGYAHPPRDLLLFFLPNIFGSPAQHSYLDVFSGQTVTALVNAAGGQIDYIFWGIKNYVEGALYVGLLPLCLAGWALLTNLRRRLPEAQFLIAFALLAVVALSFMFGAPSYGLLYQLPGMNQLNSPFRWVYALSFALAVMAGLGMNMLAERRCKASWLGRMLLVAGGGLAVCAAFSWLRFESFAALFDRFVETVALADGAFADGRALFSFLLPQGLLLVALLALSGFALLWASRAHGHRWQWLALALVGGDLLLASAGFNPASDPALLDFTPPSIEFLQGQRGHFRITSLEDERPGGPILTANIAMRYGLDDVRGYDSIIPAGYVATMRSLQPAHNLAHNRISPLYTAPHKNHAGYEKALGSDLLNLLNVRYVLTAPDLIIPLPGWSAVYRQEIAIWENGSVMPRAFTVAKADWDSRWLAEHGGGFRFDELGILQGGLHVPRYQPATISRDTGREKFVDISISADSWLVISESYMPGWRAFARPFGAGEADEFGLEVRLALANLQGVELPAGDWTVRLVYSPASVQLGMFASSISVALMIFLLGGWFWRAYIGLNKADSSGVAKVARNSIAPIILNLFNRGIDLVFAIVMYRLLLPAEVGIYNFAIVLFVAFDIFTNFGLDVFLIREAAQNKSRAGHLLYNTSLFRLCLSLAGAPLLAGALLLYGLSGAEAIGGDGLLAIGLLYIGLFPASLSKGMTSLFYANEQAEKPAAIATITTINKAVLGVIALLLGYGIVGLAAISIFNNLLTLLVLLWAGRALIGRIGPRLPDRRLLREMVGECFPLMLNHFLATVFFQIDIVILQALKGAAAVAQYSTAYKWLLAINIVPAFLTQALFPALSRQAKDNRRALSQTYRFAIKLLFAMTLPLAVAFTLLAEPLTLLLGGARYLPDGAIALQLMIWSIPFGWLNSLTQYALIALGLQRMITRAFAGAALFNIVANLIFIPQYGFQAAALATIASEVALLLPFLYLLGRELPDLRVFSLLWRPLLALAMMGLTLLILGGSLLALLAAGLVYVGALLLLRPLDAAEGEALLSLLPASARRLRLLRWITARA
ncbi:MAG: oligosaccharide flippase family protein [Chloroflexi bacterium]|nr:oligosaccharide flippase family protein [Chloroflexota bacterium]MYA93504.1 oligosaccharide flippase family protein [Chloroflexota bacterium]